MRSKLFPILIVAALCGGIACNAILGLDYSAAPTVTGDASAEDGSVVVDAGEEAGEPPPPGTIPESWPKWRMPHTGGSDGGTDAGRFEAVYTQGTETISIDKDVDRSKLVFHSKHGSESTFEAAVKYCQSLGPYRVPTRIELVTFFDFDALAAGVASAAALVPAGSTDTTAGEYWTASYVQPVSRRVNFWFVDATNGAVQAHAPSGTRAGVACIRTGSQ